MRQSYITAAVCFSLVFVGCAGGPGKPAAGTPAFYWSAALESYAAGDYDATSRHLARLGSGNEYAEQARAMRLVLVGGLMLGHQDLADHYEHGARANRANPMPFHRRVAAYRGAGGATRWALEFSDAYRAFMSATPGEQVTLAFPFPPRGAMAVAPQMPKVAQGLMLSDTELENARITMVRRGVARAVCHAAGAPGDAPKAKEILKSQPTQIPRAVFQTGMAEMLYAGSKLFGEFQGNDPRTQAHFLRQAAEAAASALPEKTADLKKRIEEDRKKLARRRPS